MRIWPMRLWTVLLPVLLIAGCASEQEIAARDIARCESFGFKPDTEAFAQCRLGLYTARYRGPDPVYYGPGPGFYPSRYYRYW